MTFQEAKQKLFEIADGKYHSLQYGICVHESGMKEVSCRVYIDGTDGCTEPTWEKAFNLLANQPEDMQIDETEAPICDVVQDEIECECTECDWCGIWSQSIGGNNMCPECSSELKEVE